MRPFFVLSILTTCLVAVTPAPTMEPTSEMVLSYSYATPAPVPAPTKQPIPAPTPMPTSFPTSTDTVAIAVSVAMSTTESAVSDSQKSTLKTSVAAASGVSENSIKDFAVIVTPARRRLSDSPKVSLRRLASYTWTINYKVVSSLSAAGHASVESFQAAIETSLQANLATTVLTDMGIAVVVTGVSTTNVSSNAGAVSPPTTAPTEAADTGLSAGMIAFISCLSVALVIGCAIFIHHRANKHNTPGYDKAEPMDAGSGTANPMAPTQVTVLLETEHEQDAVAHFRNLVPERVDARTARRYSGHLFSQEHFDEVSGPDGTISRVDFLAKKHEAGPRHGAVTGWVDDAPALQPASSAGADI